MRSFEFADDQKMLEAVRQLPGVPRERRLEEKLLVQWMTARLHHFATGAHQTGGIMLELDKSTLQFGQEQQAVPGRITEAEVEALNCKFDCAGCGRKEVSRRSRDGHRRHCAYVQLIETWVCPDDEDGEWEVAEIMDVRAGAAILQGALGRWH
jgi:hypothetical protein